MSSPAVAPTYAREAAERFAHAWSLSVLDGRQKSNAASVVVKIANRVIGRAAERRTVSLQILRSGACPRRIVLSTAVLGSRMAADTDGRDHVAVTSMRVIRERIAARAVDAAHTTTSELMGAPQGRAAVAIVVRDCVHGPQVLLIRRAEHPGDAWSGHMAFPGGREEPEDENPLATAIRETLEELALDLRQAGRLLGQLAPLPAVARGRPVGMTIVPFVFELTTDAELTYSEEVAEVVWVPLEPLLQGRLRTTFAVDRRGGEFAQLPAHDVDGRIVWGLTYRMLDSLFELLR